MSKIVNSKVVVGLEVGTSKVAAVVGEILPDGVINVLGVGSAPSKGINSGSITDLDAVVNAIKQAVENAESIADCHTLSVTLAISGSHISSLNERGLVPVASGEVSQQDVLQAMHTAQSVKLSEGHKVLHVIPQGYEVDKQKNIKNPVGLQGVRLSAQAHLISCHQDFEKNLRKAVERSGLKVDEIVFSGLASSYSVLTEDEKDLGVCLIDFGAGTMDVIVYTDGAIRYSKVMPFAGNRVTEDIAQVFATSRADAEKLKVNNGSAVTPPAFDGDKRIEVNSVGGRPPRALTKSSLSEVIAPRYEEMLSKVKRNLDKLHDELKKSGIKPELIAGVVITGGGAQIEGIEACAQEVFNSQVRVGIPMNITGLTDYVSTPQYATVLGLLQRSYLESGDDSIGYEEPKESSLSNWNIGEKFKSMYKSLKKHV